MAEGLEPEDVYLFVYDLSKGVVAVARHVPAILGLGSIPLLGDVDGIWHTSIVVYGTEFSYSNTGIDHNVPGGTSHGKPDDIYFLGKTDVSSSTLREYLRDLERSSFSGDKYNLIDNNCNVFSNTVSRYLTGHSIPSNILDLPDKVFDSPLGQWMEPLARDPSVGKMAKAAASQNYSSSVAPRIPSILGLAMVPVGEVLKIRWGENPLEAFTSMAKSLPLEWW